MFTPGPLSRQDADDLNRLAALVANLARMDVSAPLILRRGADGQQPLISFNSANTLTVQNSDVTAVDNPTATLQFDKTTGVSTSGVDGTSTVSGIDANHIQKGMINLSNQVLGSGAKSIANGHLNITSAKYTYQAQPALNDVYTVGVPNHNLLLSYTATQDAPALASFGIYPPSSYPHAMLISTGARDTVVSASNAVTLIATDGTATPFSSPLSGFGAVSVGQAYAGADTDIPLSMWDPGYPSAILHGKWELVGSFTRTGFVAACAPNVATAKAQFVVRNAEDIYAGWRGTVTIGAIKFYFAGGIIYQVDKSGTSQALGANA